MRIYVGVGMEMDVPGETNTKMYTSLDQKVDLMIERMSECVRLVREYMDQNRMTDGQHHPGDRAVFGVMLRDFERALRGCENIKNTCKQCKCCCGGSNPHGLRNLERHVV